VNDTEKAAVNYQGSQQEIQVSEKKKQDSDMRKSREKREDKRKKVIESRSR